MNTIGMQTEGGQKVRKATRDPEEAWRRIAQRTRSLEVKEKTNEDQTRNKGVVCMGEPAQG